MLFNNITLSNKPFILNNFVTAQNFDIFFVIQTWLKPDDCCPRHRTLPKFLNSPRCSGHGGGIAVIYKVYLSCVAFDACSFDSFDLVSFNYSITDHIHHQREGRKAKCRWKKTNLSPCSLQYPYKGVTSHTQPTHKRCENIFFLKVWLTITNIVRSFYLTSSANFLILLSLLSLPCLPMGLNFFLDFFTGKINSIRSQLKSVPLPSVSNRYFKIHINQSMSSSAPFIYGVPWVKSLDQLCFPYICYPWAKELISFNGISYPCYPDDRVLFSC